MLAARAARRLGEFNRADAYLQQCPTSGPLAEEIRLEKILLRASRGEVENVGAYLLALVEQKHPATPLVLEALVYGNMQLYRLGVASIHLEAWFKREPNNAQALTFEGIMHSQMQNHWKAAASFRRALTAEPDIHQARLYLVDALLNLQLAHEALPHAEYLCQRLPDYAPAQLRRAVCLAGVGRPREAEKVLDELLARNPNSGFALIERGQLALRAGQLETAEAMLRKGCLQQPDSHQAHYQLYLCLSQEGKKDEAQEVLKRLEQLKDDLERVRELVAYKVQQSPHDPALQHELGSVLLRIGSVDEGLRWLHRALQDDPNYTPTHALLANYYENVGQLGRAAQHRIKARAAPAPRKKQNE